MSKVIKRVSDLASKVIEWVSDLVSKLIKRVKCFETTVLLEYLSKSVCSIRVLKQMWFQLFWYTSSVHSVCLVGMQDLSPIPLLCSINSPYETLYNIYRTTGIERIHAMWYRWLQNFYMLLIRSPQIRSRSQEANRSKTRICNQ